MAEKEVIKKKKPLYKRWWVWLLAVIIIGSIASNGGDDESSTTEKPTEQTTAKVSTKTEAKAEAPKQQEFTVGQDVKVGKFTYKVVSVNETNSLKSVLGDKTTSGKFAIVELSVLNGDKKPRMADTNMFKIKTADGTEYEADATLDMYVNEGDTGFFLQDINPNLSKTGKVVFELPSTATAYNLEVSSGFGWSGGEYKQIKLK